MARKYKRSALRSPTQSVSTPFVSAPLRRRQTLSPQSMKSDRVARRRRNRRPLRCQGHEHREELLVRDFAIGGGQHGERD